MRYVHMVYVVCLVLMVYGAGLLGLCSCVGGAGGLCLLWVASPLSLRSVWAG